MARRSIRWLVVATLFTLANLAGLAYALFLYERPHAGVHLALVVAGVFWIRELLSRREPSATPFDETAELSPDERMAQLERSLGAIADEVDRVGDGQRELVRLERERLAGKSAREKA